jgi:hypothetical protein
MYQRKLSILQQFSLFMTDFEKAYKTHLQIIFFFQRRAKMHRYIILKIRYLPLMFAFLFVTACGPIVPTPTPTPTHPPTPTSTPFPEIDLDMDLPEGDAEKGFLTAIRYSCHGCHVNELHPTSGPRFLADTEIPFILERGTIRVALPDYEGRATTNREYIIESVFLPEIYLAPGEWEKSMPTYFYQVMTDQELADILAWMASLE